MSTWREKNAALLASLAETPNPSVRGNAIGCYLRDARKDQWQPPPLAMIYGGCWPSGRQSRSPSRRGRSNT